MVMPPRSLAHPRTLGLQAGLKGWGEGWARGRAWPLSSHTHLFQGKSAVWLNLDC